MAARLSIVPFSPERQFANVDAMSRRPHALQAFLYLFLVVVQSVSDDSVQLSEGFGGRHGTKFSDEASVIAGQTIGSVTIRANKQVDGVSLEVLGPRATTFSHGGSGEEEHVLKLGDQEHITSMEAHWGERNGRTRIFYLSFETSVGNMVAAGSKTTDMQTITAPEGFQLGGFFGRGGDDIDMLGAVWSRISADAPVEEARAVVSPAISALESLDATENDVSSTRSLETSTEESTDESSSGSDNSAESTSDSSSGSADPAESTSDSSSGSANPAESAGESSSGSVDPAESGESSLGSVDPAESAGESSSGSANPAESTGDSSSGSANPAESAGESSSGSVDPAESGESSLGSVDPAESAGESSSGSANPAESTGDSSSGSANPAESAGESSSGSVDPAESGESPLGSVDPAESAGESSSGSANPAESTGDSSSGSANPAESAGESSSGSVDQAESGESSLGSVDPAESAGESSLGSVDPAESAGESSSGSANPAESTSDSSSGSANPAESAGESSSGSVDPAESGESPLGSVDPAESAGESSLGSVDPAESAGESSSGSANPAESTGDSSSGSANPAESAGESSSGSVDPAESGESPLGSVDPAESAGDSSSGSANPAESTGDSSSGSANPAESAGESSSGSVDPAESGESSLGSVDPAESAGESSSGSANPAESTGDSSSGSANPAESAGESSSGSVDPAESGESPLGSVDPAESAGESSSGSANPAESTGESSSGSVDLAESAGESSSGSADPAESPGESSSGSADPAESPSESWSGSADPAESIGESLSGSVDPAESAGKASAGTVHPTVLTQDFLGPADPAESTGDSSSGSVDLAESAGESSSGSADPAESPGESSSGSADPAESPSESWSGSADPAESIGESLSGSVDPAESAGESSLGSVDPAESTGESSSGSVDSAESTCKSSSGSADPVESVGESSSGSVDPAESAGESSLGSVDPAESTGESSSGSVDSAESTDGAVAGSTDDMEFSSLQTAQEEVSAVGSDSSTASGEGIAARDTASSSTTGSKQVSLDGIAVGLTEQSASVSAENSVAASEEGSAARDIRSSLADSTEASDAISTEGSKVSFDETSAAALGAVALAAKDTGSSSAESTEASDATSTEGSKVTSDEMSAATSEENSAAGDTSSSLAESMEASDARSAEGSGVSSVEMSAADSTAGSSSAETVVPPAENNAPLGPVMAVKDSIVLSESLGGTQGRDFSDKNFVNSGQTVKAISIYANKRLDGISLTISAPKTLTFTHGGTGGNRQELVLGKGEYINSMEVHRGEKDDSRRIFYVSFLTSTGRALSGGSVTGDKLTVTAPEGFQLAGFFGKDGKEIDALGAVWAFIDLVKPAPAPVPVAIPVEDLPGTVGSDDIAGSLSEVKAKVNKLPVQLSDSFGGPHGDEFSDQLAITSGMTIASVTIRAGKRVDGLTVQVSAPKEMTFIHGGHNGKEHTMVLRPGEYITSMEAHWGEKNGHTRIFFLSMSTSKGNILSGGSKTIEKGSVTAPKGYQLAGFFGRYGDEIDLIGAVWSSIALMNETVSAPVSADDDIALSQLFGGPHGSAFSDIKKIKFGQTVSAITIRANLRLDAVTVRISAPADLTWNHGGHGGTEKMLALGPNEIITSVEFHWAKKSGHTAVFYICFTTSANKTLAGGTQTDNRATATPPEGFVFSGFYGRADDGVDQLGVIWTRKTAKDLLLTDPSGVGNNTYGATIRNWVGPAIGRPSDTACYRKSVNFDRNNMCPLGYDKDDIECVVQCPMAFPVKCGLECIPQNDNCALAVLQKIGSVAAVALNLATGSVLGQVKAAFKTAKWAALCIRSLIEVIRGLIYYLRYRQTTGPVGDTAEILAAVYQTDLVVYDLPYAVCTCLNIPVPKNAVYVSYVLATVEGIVKQVITNGDVIISTAENVMNLLTGTGIANKSRTTVDELEDLVSANSSCGWNLKRLTDRVTRAVLRYRNTSTSVADLRVKVYESSIVLNDIPVITNNCMGELLAAKTMATAYETRDLIRKTFGVIVDQLIETGKTDNGKDVAEDDYALEVTNMGLVGLSVIDPSGIAYMASQFVQPVCGPTAYLGEIDDGTLYDALGMTLVDEAFIGSYGSYTHAGDGVIHLVFESVDTKDVTVSIHSGGEEYGKVDVGAGDIVAWDATFPELEDKTMYLDRWRPGFLGLPGSGGGSLLLWIPRSSGGGHITMHVRINPS